MRSIFSLPAMIPWLVLLALASAPALGTAEDVSGDTPNSSGKLLGAKMSSHPDWFKESFLDIAEDVNEATDADKHVILFLEMNGCPYCYKMIEENFKGSDYSDWLQTRFDVIALNIRGDREVALNPDTTLSEKALAEQLAVRYTPTVIFLNADNEPVARINGYRDVRDFKQVLDYVDTRAYENRTLAEYLAAQKAEAVDSAYSFRKDPKIREATEIEDLSTIAGPLALLFEDAACVACNALHDGHLAAPGVARALEPFTVVRVDALSDERFTGLDSQPTTGRKLAHALGVEYRPTLVLFDDSAGAETERARIESMLYRYHFIGLLEYVGLGKYRDFPDSPFDYINHKTAQLTAAGEDVSISDE